MRGWVVPVLWTLLALSGCITSDDATPPAESSNDADPSTDTEPTEPAPLNNTTTSNNVTLPPEPDPDHVLADGITVLQVDSAQIVAWHVRVTDTTTIQQMSRDESPTGFFYIVPFEPSPCDRGSLNGLLSMGAQWSSLFNSDLDAGDYWFVGQFTDGAGSIRVQQGDSEEDRGTLNVDVQTSDWTFTRWNFDIPVTEDGSDAYGRTQGSAGYVMIDAHSEATYAPGGAVLTTAIDVPADCAIGAYGGPATVLHVPVLSPLYVTSNAGAYTTNWEGYVEYDTDTLTDVEITATVGLLQSK